MFEIHRIIRILPALLIFFACSTKNDKEISGDDRASVQIKPQVAALVWPAYHHESKMNEFYHSNNGEWERIYDARPKFEGHIQPRYPLWGYVHEDDPEVMEMKIETAAKYGVDIFIYDWYWYNEGPYLEEALNEGYLKARNNHLVKFYLMWANHDAMTTWDIERSHEREIVWFGTVDRKNFETVVKRVISQYFHHPSYFRINGEPVFSIYDLANLIKGLGGIPQTVDAINYLREEVKKSGFPGLHLQLMLRNYMLQNESDLENGKISYKDIEQFHFSSFSHYQWVHVAGTGKDYIDWGMDAISQWAIYEKTFNAPYFPHVSIGWDNNPRFKDKTDIVRNSTPRAFKSFIIKAREYLDLHPDQPQVIIINSWNEWVEGSYLEPDMRNGYAYLEALQQTLSDK